MKQDPPNWFAVAVFATIILVGTLVVLSAGGML